MSIYLNSEVTGKAIGLQSFMYNREQYSYNRRSSSFLFWTAHIYISVVGLYALCEVLRFSTAPFLDYPHIRTRPGRQSSLRLSKNPVTECHRVCITAILLSRLNVLHAEASFLHVPYHRESRVHGKWHGLGLSSVITVSLKQYLP
jgi:hypothetical protein